MRSIYKYILNFIIILYSSLHLYAYQETFKSLSVSEGMTDLVVNSIYKDSRGFIWFGTNSSLEKFDGIRLKRYDIDAPANKKRVYVLTEDSSYGILCGTGRGIYQLDIKDDKFVPLFQDVIDCRVNAIYRFSKDKLLVATEKGLYVCTDNSVVKSALYEAFPLPQNNVTGIAPASDALSVWLSTMDGVVQYNPSANEVKRYRCNDSGLSDSFYNIASIGNYIYLGTMDSGLMRFDVVNHKYSSYVDVGCSVISSLSCDGNDMLYVGTDGNGVHFVSVKDSSVVKSYRHIPNRKGGIRSNSIYSVLVDRDGLIWVGLYQMGVDYTLYQSGLFEVYQWKDRFTTKDMSVRTISFNGNQRLIGSRDGLVFIDEDRDIVKSYNIPELRSNMIISSCYYDGRFYIGTYGGGMYVLNPETLVISDFTSDKPFVNGHIFCIRPDYEGNLWIGTSSGLYCFNNGKQIYHFVSSRSKIPDGNVYEIFFDSLHRGWICTETGICQWEPSIKAIRKDVFPDGFVNSEKIRSICETSSGELYFLPEKGKIFRTDIAIGEFSFLENAKIFDDKQFLSLVEDGLGGMFITTNNGLYRSDSCKNIIPYNFTDGIPDPIFTNCVSVRDSSGVFWFGNSKGLVCLKPEKINKLRKNNYKIEITDVLINGKKSEYALQADSENKYTIEVDDSNYNISVLFSGMLYSEPSNMIYEYTIDGNDEWLWRPLDNSKYLRISSFEDNNPHGFGLLQRDRKPEHYLDFEAMYEQRPSLWVEPLENWGKGVVQLVEIPSIQEIHDNIVAFWIPDQKIEAGKEYHFSYRLHWTGDAPIESNLAKVTATYTGIGGVSGMLNVDKRKFVIDFSAPKIKGLNWEQEIKDGKITADISISEGKFLGSHLMFNPVTKAPTLYMDFRPNGKTAEVRAVLKRNGKAVSEVWSYQWLP